MLFRRNLNSVSRCPLKSVRKPVCIRHTCDTNTSLKRFAHIYVCTVPSELLDRCAANRNKKILLELTDIRIRHRNIYRNRKYLLRSLSFIVWTVLRLTHEHVHTLAYIRNTHSHTHTTKRNRMRDARNEKRFEVSATKKFFSPAK